LALTAMQYCGAAFALQCCYVTTSKRTRQSRSKSSDSHENHGAPKYWYVIRSMQKWIHLEQCRTTFYNRGHYKFSSKLCARSKPDINGKYYFSKENLFYI